jgi:hypothetical protein
MGRGPCVWNRIGSCRFAQFNAVAIHRLAMRVRSDPRVLAAQMGMAVDLSPRTELARSSTRYEQLGTILCRSLRRLLWAGSVHGGHAGCGGAALRLKVVPAQASRPLGACHPPRFSSKFPGSNERRRHSTPPGRVAPTLLTRLRNSVQRECTVQHLPLLLNLLAPATVEVAGARQAVSQKHPTLVFIRHNVAEYSSFDNPG